MFSAMTAERIWSAILKKGAPGSMNLLKQLAASRKTKTSKQQKKETKMYHYLTTKDGNKIVDVEPWIKDGHYEFCGGVCNIKHLINSYEAIPADMREEFKADFDAIDKMRGWFFERFMQSDLNRVVSDENLTKTHHAIKNWLVLVAKKYDLNYGED